ncbi:MAG: GNAT family N-acetyltransferase [Thermoguttaceae bacterium]|nr:GNAT family N-acetyltransferase [Thermoguttaceae bacterium]
MGNIHINTFTRYKMQISLESWKCPEIKLPAGFEMAPWSTNLIHKHSEAIYKSFKDSIDAQFFITFTQQSRCEDFMRYLANRSGFLPSATWLLREKSGCAAARLFRLPSCYKLAGTIQGLITPEFIGAIQNVGILPEYRGRGLSKLLLYYCLWGYQQAGVKTVQLEVTQINEVAINLYQKIGFHVTEVIEKMPSL